MATQFAHGLRLLLTAPFFGIIAHIALVVYARRQRPRRESAGAARGSVPLPRALAVYSASLAAMGLLAALDVAAFLPRLLFGLVFFLGAFCALRLEHAAKQRLRSREEAP